MTWRVLALSPLPVEILQQMFGDPRAELVVPSARTQAAVDEQLPEVDIVVGDWTHQLRVDDPSARVSLVQMPSVGVDTINLAACAAAGVPVANTAGANARSVAEWCLAATLALFRKTVEGDGAVRRGEWPQISLGARDLAGSRIGVLGMGAIGSRVAQLFGALDCEVQYWSRSRREGVPAAYVELDGLLASSDVVVVVIPLAPDTRQLLDSRRLGQLKPGSFVVNGARGGIIDEDALIDALRSGQVGGAALDVFRTEPLPATSPLRELPRVVLSPHMAGSSEQAAAAIVAQSAANLRRAYDGAPLVDVVNGVDPVVRRR